MRLNHLPILIVLWLTNCFLSEPTTTSESESEIPLPTIDDLLQQRPNSEGKNTTRLSQLSVEVQFVIFDRLSEIELFKVVHTDPSLTPIAGEIFRKLRGNRMNVYLQPPRSPFLASYMQTVMVSADALKYFGAYVDKVSLDVDENLPRSTANFDKLANEYASEFLKILDVKHVRSDTLEQFTKPFKSVEELSFEIKLNQC